MSLGFSGFKFFFTFPFSPFLIFLQQWFTFYWACFQFKIIYGKHHQDRHILPRNFAPHFSLNFLNIFMHIFDSTEPITLIWVSLERFFPPVELEWRCCQFWSKVMASKVEQRPMLTTVTGGQHRSHWVIYS